MRASDAGGWRRVRRWARRGALVACLGLAGPVGLAGVAGCGGTPSALPEAEGRLAQQDLEGAERAFRAATTQYLTEAERARVRAGLVAIAEARLAGRLAEAEAKPGFAGVEALAEVRKWLHRQGAGKDDDGKPTAGDTRVVAALVARIDSLWPAVTALSDRQHFAGAMDEAERLLAPLGRDRPEALKARYAALRDAARDFHLARYAEAKRADGTPAEGSQAFHAGLVQRFGGKVASPIGALRAAAQVQVSASAEASGACDGAAQAVAKGTHSGGARAAQVTVKLTACEGTSQATEKQSRYTWIEQVPYQVTERVQVSTRQVVDARRTCSRDSVSFSEGNRKRTVTTTTYDCSTYRAEPVYADKVVTKYRAEKREGVRTERIEHNQVTYAGSAHITWEGGKLQVPISQQLQATDTTWNTPHGRQDADPAKSVGGLKVAAQRAIQTQLVTRARQGVNAMLANRWFTEATRAQAAGERVLAEDADVRGVVHAEAVGPPVAARLGSPYGLDAAGVQAALDGKAPPVASSGLSLQADDTLKLGVADKAKFEDGEGILERGFNIGRAELGLRHFGSIDLPGQPDRTALSFLMRTAYPLFGQMFDGKRFDAKGLVLYDTLMFDLWLGGRTSDPWIYFGGKDEDSFALGIGAGYQLLGGYRGRYGGLFAGVRTQRFWRNAGDFTTAGGSHPFVARLEVTVFDRNPMAFEVYGFKAFGTGSVRGADALFTLTGIHGITVRYEESDLDARYLGGGISDVIDLGRQRARILDLLYVVQF